jgi:tetratricopeptide (TPR) repeat protein
MDGEEYRSQVLKNIIYTIDLAECSVRQLILPDMPPQEKLFYYQKAATLLETVLDGKYAGFYDPPLVSDYAEIAKIYVQLGETDKAEEYINRILAVFERHMIASEKENKSQILYSTTLRNAVPTEQICQKLLQNMLDTTEFEQFKDIISNFATCFYQNKLGG